VIDTLAQALVEAGRVRLRPVLLTAAATALAVVPLATGYARGFRFRLAPRSSFNFFKGKSGHFVIGAESAAFWGPLGVAIIFGLTIATFLTLVIVPTFYALLESWAKKIAAAARRIFVTKTDDDLAVEKSR
jgi:multidrug efflux pump subunit AcrB